LTAARHIPDKARAQIAKATATTIGLDIAKSVFQVHDIDVEGKVAVSHEADQPLSLEA
jgi:hypothetical protein